MVNAALEELADQHSAAQAGRAQGLAEHRREAAAERGGVNLQQSLRPGHQSQRGSPTAGFAPGAVAMAGEAGGHRREDGERQQPRPQAAIDPSTGSLEGDGSWIPEGLGGRVRRVVIGSDPDPVN